MNLWVYVCVCVCICMYIYMYVCMYVYVYMYVYIIHCIHILNHCNDLALNGSLIVNKHICI